MVSVIGVRDEGAPPPEPLRSFAAKPDRPAR